MFKFYDFLKSELSPWKAFSISIILSLLFTYPLLFSHIYYEDDLFRIFTGGYVWQNLGRIFTYYIMHLVTFSYGNMLNVTPIPLLLSILVVAKLIIDTSKYILGKINVLTIIVGSCFIFNPYMLSNLSYSYDSLHMVIGLYFSISAFIWFDKNKYISILFVIFSLLFYQPMGNVFLALSFYNVFTSSLKNDKSNKILLGLILRLLVYATSIVIYMIIIKLYYLIFPYNIERNELIPFLEFISGKGIDVIIRLYTYIYILFKNVEGKFIALILFSNILGAIFVTRNFYKLLLIILSFIGLFLSLLGPMIFLKEGLITARILTPLGVIILTCLYFPLQYINHKIYIFNYMAIFTIFSTFWYFITLSFGYGNYISLQRKYDESLLNMVQYDILVLSQNNPLLKEKQIYLQGCPQKPKSVQLQERLRPFYSQISPPACSWRARFIVFDSILGNFKLDRSWRGFYPQLKDKICQARLTPTIDRGLYQIYTNNEFILVNLGKNINCNE